jgi:hypothetical protein
VVTAWTLPSTSLAEEFADAYVNQSMLHTNAPATSAGLRQYPLHLAPPSDRCVGNSIVYASSVSTRSANSVLRIRPV